MPSNNQQSNQLLSDVVVHIGHKKGRIRGLEVNSAKQALFEFGELLFKLFELGGEVCYTGFFLFDHGRRCF